MGIWGCNITTKIPIELGKGNPPLKMWSTIAVLHPMDINLAALLELCIEL